MKRVFEKQGYSLVSLLLGMAAASLLLVVAATALLQMNRFRSSVLTKGTLDTDVILLYEHILKIGRLADYCAWTPGSASPVENPMLYCEVNFTVPRQQGAAHLTPVRFVQSGTDVAYQRLLNPVDFSTWRTEQNYRSINAFLVCDDMAVRSGNCPFVPAKMNEAHLASLTSLATWENHFFRFQVQGMAPERQADQTMGHADEYRFSLQGSFFLRNGTKITTDRGIAFEWRGR